MSNIYNICHKNYLESRNRAHLIIVKSTKTSALCTLLSTLPLMNHILIEDIWNDELTNRVSLLEHNVSNNTNTVILWEVKSIDNFDEVEKFFQNETQFCTKNKIITIGTDNRCILKKPIDIRGLISTIFRFINYRYYIDDNVIFDYHARKLYKAEGSYEVESLTEKEAELLKYLIENHISLIDITEMNKQEILFHIWGYKQNINTATFEIHAYKLKQKLLKFTEKI